MTVINGKGVHTNIYVVSGYLHHFLQENADAILSFCYFPLKHYTQLLIRDDEGTLKPNPVNVLLLDSLYNPLQ